MKNNIVIVGMGQGLSYGIAEKFGKEGFNIGMISRNSENLQSFQQQLIELGINSEYAVADVSDTQQLIQALNSLKEKLGKITVLQYNAVDYRMKNLMDETVEDLTNGFKISVANAFASIKELLSDLKETNGAVLLTGGGLAYNPSAEMASISLGKAGLRNLAYQLHQSLQKENVFVGIVTINGMIQKESETHNPKKIAEQFWELFSSRKDVEVSH